MILAIVKVTIPKEMDLDEYTAHCEDVAPNFEDLPGLIRKNFLYSADERVAGGVYCWETREAAEECYRKGGVWRKNIQDFFQAEPEITYYHSPVVTDNALGEIIKAVS